MRMRADKSLLAAACLKRDLADIPAGYLSAWLAEHLPDKLGSDDWREMGLGPAWTGGIVAPKHTLATGL